MGIQVAVMGLTRLIIPWIVVETWFLLYANGK